MFSGSFGVRSNSAMSFLWIGVFSGSFGVRSNSAM